MNKKKFLAIGIMIFLVLVGIFSAYFVVADLSKGDVEKSTVTYTSTTDTICQSGICTKTLWSGIRNAYEDNQWKRVENARSLKGSGIECVIDSDGENLVECLDWNMTSIKLRLSQKTVSLIDKEIPIKIYERNETGDLILKSETKESFSSLSNEKDKELLDFEYGDIIHFGDKSTTIMLQDNETENLDDAGVYKSNPSLNSSVLSEVDIRDSLSQASRVYLKFNISSLPNNVDLSSSKSCVHTSYTSNPTNNASIYHVYNHFWIEETLNWANQECGENFDDSVNCNLTADSSFDPSGGGWKCVDVSYIVDYDYSNNNKNVSFVYKTLETGTGENYTAIRVLTKEYFIDITKRPYLNITYTEAIASPHLFLLDKHFTLKDKHFILKGD